MTELAATGSKRCPLCGRGDLVDITYREDAGSPAGRHEESIQTPETRQVETYSCGHEVIGPHLARTAGSEELEAERRESDETTEPL